MKNGTKILLVGLAGLGIYLYLRNRKSTPIRKPIQQQPPQQQPQSQDDSGNASEGTSSGGFSEDNLSTPTGSTPISSTLTPTPATTGTTGTTTNAGTIITGPNTPAVSPDSTTTTTIGHGTGTTGLTVPTTTTSTPTNPCAQKDGFSVATFNSANTDISRARQECIRSGGNWASTSTGGCCIKPLVTPTFTSPQISSPVVSSSSTSCFIADTMIKMSDGSQMKIQDVKVGMEVLSFNEETKNQEYSKVEQVIIGSSSQLVNIKTKSGIKISCTKEHPFWVVDSGTGWIQALFLEEGDKLLLENGNPDEIVSIEIDKVSELPVYNLTISDNKTYYANGVLVHNKDLIFGQTYYGAQAQQIVRDLQSMFASQQYNLYYSPGTSQYAYNTYMSA